MKLGKYLFALLLMIGLLISQSCSNKENFDVEGNANNLVSFVLVKQTTPINIISHTVSSIPIGVFGEEILVKVPVKATRRAEGNIRVKAKVDNSLVDWFNKENGTTYVALEQDDYQYIHQTATIQSGEFVSTDSIEVSVPLESLKSTSASTYLVPISLSEVDGNGRITTNPIYGTIWAEINILRPEYQPLTIGFDSSIKNIDYSSFPAVYTFTANADGVAWYDETVTFEVDRSLVANYNTGRTYYQPLPENADFIIEGLNAKMDPGMGTSTEIKFTLKSLANLTVGDTYMLPIKISSVSNGLNISSTSNVMCIVVKYIDPNAKPFKALDISDFNLYTNYSFPTPKKLSEDFSYQIKFMANSFSGISRFFTFNGTRGFMMRFGEGGIVNRLQYCTSSTGTSNHFGGTLFETGVWYEVTMTYSAANSKMNIYIDGVKELSLTKSNYSNTLSGFEFGMSWAGYPEQQQFNGSIRDIRVWNKELTEEEIRSFRCELNPSISDLLLQLKLDEGEGHIFNDATGNGYNVDMTNTWREINESGTVNSLDKSQYIKWDTNSSNICD